MGYGCFTIGPITPMEDFMAHTAHHDGHHHDKKSEKNSHHHAAPEPKAVLPGVILVLALFWCMTYAGHYVFIKSMKGGHAATNETHGQPDAGHH